MAIAVRKPLSRLACGNIRVLFLPKESSTFHLRIKVSVGSAAEAYPRDYGTAHFLEHMMFKGTKSRSREQLSMTLGRLGESNAGTCYDETSYHLTVLPENIGEALDVLLDMFLNSTLDADEMEKERNVILEECQMYEDDPSAFFYNRLMADALGKEHGHHIIGNKASISDIRRDNLLSFMSAFYNQKTVTILASGPLREKQMASILGRQQPKLASSDVRFLHERLGNGLSKCPLDETPVAYEHPSKQSIMALVFPGMSRAHSMEKNMVDVVMMRCIGGEFGGMMYKRIRDELGLCYSICCLSWSIYRNSLTVISTMMDKKNLLECRDEIVAILRSVRRIGVGKDTLELAKQSLKFKLASGTNSPIGTVETILDDYDEVGYVDVKERMRKIDSVSNDDIVRWANQTFGTPKVVTLNP